MLFDLPDDDTLYRALQARDAGYAGQVYVCIAATGAFCCLTCPEPTPALEDCSFRDSIGACIEAGFRPCQHCAPLRAAALTDPVIAALLEALDAQPERRWSAQDLVLLGYALPTVRRSFKRHFGMTFLEMARQRRLREGFESAVLPGVTLAPQAGAFASVEGFRAGLTRLLGSAPARGQGLLCAYWVPTPLGDMVAVASHSHLHLLEFADRKALPAELQRLAKAAKGGIGIGRIAVIEQAQAELAQFFAGERAEFETPLFQEGSAFSGKVWAALRRIPAGEIRSYAQLAQAIDRPKATRAVARANGANQIALMVPCHRVIGADGALTGYGGGLWRKQRLLEIERCYLA